MIFKNAHLGERGIMSAIYPQKVQEKNKKDDKANVVKVLLFVESR